MKRVILALLLLTSPAFADDVQGIFYNPTLHQFQGQTRANGMVGFRQGVTDGSSPCTGCVGEVLANTMGSTQILATGVTGDSGIVNVGSFALLPGYYLCSANCWLNSSGTGVYSKVQCGLSTANNTLLQQPTNAYTAQAGSSLTTSGINNVLPTGTTTLNVASRTTYFGNIDVNATSNSGATNAEITATCLRTY